MGKTFCLLIAIISCFAGEYVKDMSPFKSTKDFEFSKLLENSKSSNLLENSNISKNSKSQKIQNKKTAEHVLENSKNSQQKSYKKANLTDFYNSKNSKIISGQKSDEYIFWAKFFTTNQMLSTRIIAFSKAMQKSDESEFLPFCELKMPRFYHQSELEYFKANEEALADCFTKSPFYVLEYSNFLQNGSKLKTNLKTNITQIPVHFIAIFKGYGAIILAKIEN